MDLPDFERDVPMQEYAASHGFSYDGDRVTPEAFRELMQSLMADEDPKGKQQKQPGGNNAKNQ